MVHLQPSFLMMIGGRNMDDKVSAAYRTLREATPRPSSALRLLCRGKNSDWDKFYHRYILLESVQRVALGRNKETQHLWYWCLNHQYPQRLGIDASFPQNSLITDLEISSKCWTIYENMIQNQVRIAQIQSFGKSFFRLFHVICLSFSLKVEWRVASFLGLRLLSQAGIFSDLHCKGWHSKRGRFFALNYRPDNF